MLSTLFRALFYLAPFIKEVFISSSEEKRQWIGRFFLTLLIVLVLAYAGSRHLLTEFNTLERENHVLHSQLIDKDEKIKTWASRYEVLQGIIQDKNITIDKLLDQNQRLQKENGELKTEVHTIKSTMDRLDRDAPSHSLPKPKPPPKVNVPKQTTPPKKQADRLGDLN